MARRKPVDMAALRAALLALGNECEDIAGGRLNDGGCGAYALAVYDALCSLGLCPTIYAYGEEGDTYFRHVWLWVDGIGSIDSDMMPRERTECYEWSAEYLRRTVADADMWNDWFPRECIPQIDATVSERITALAA